jgi:hypothetical protein
MLGDRIRIQSHDAVLDGAFGAKRAGLGHEPGGDVHRDRQEKFPK